MKFEGKVTPPVKGEKYWSVAIPHLDVYTQGKSEKDAYAMARDAVETVVGRTGFKAAITIVGKGRFYVEGNRTAPLLARYLAHLRSASGLTVRQVSARLGSRSPTAYSQYERGEVCPSLEKLSEIIHAIDPKRDMVFQVRRVS